MSDDTLKEMIEKQRESYKSSQVKVRLKQEKKDAVDLQKGRVSRETIEKRNKMDDEKRQVQSKREEWMRKVKDDVLMKKVAEELQRQKTNEDLSKVDMRVGDEYHILGEMNATRTGGVGVTGAQNGGADGEGGPGEELPAGFQPGTHADGTQFDNVQSVGIQPGEIRSNTSHFPGGKSEGAQFNDTRGVGDKGGVQVCTLGLDELGRPVFTGASAAVPTVGTKNGFVKNDQLAKAVDIEQLEEDVRNTERQVSLYLLENFTRR